jgi:hypothetical protein
MRKFAFYFFVMVAGIKAVSAQSKTDLSLQVSAAAANRAQLAAYVWTRTVQVFVGGVLKAAAISQSGNTINVTGSSVKQPNDQFGMVISSGNLAINNQRFSSTSDGDAISGNINYRTFDNGLTAFDSGELDLPAKNMKLMISNTNYAKKLQ